LELELELEFEWEEEDNWYSLDQVPTTSHLVKTEEEGYITTGQELTTTESVYNSTSSDLFSSTLPLVNTTNGLEEEEIIETWNTEITNIPDTTTISGFHTRDLQPAS
jgi:hypothetical protein